MKQIGIHITRNEIRAAYILSSQNHYQLLKTACLPIQSTIAHALQTLRQQWRAAQIPVIFTIPYDQVVCKTVTLASNLTARELAFYFHSQTSQWLGLSIGGIYFDYHPLPLQQWQIVATKKDHLQEKITLAKTAALRLQAVDVDLLAITRLHSFIHPVAEEPIGVAMIENHHLQFLIITASQLLFQTHFTLPAMDSPLYFQHLRTILSQQTIHQTDLRIIYFAASPTFLATVIEKIQNALSLSIQPLRFLSSLKVDSLLDHRLIISIAAALWGLK